jgi:TRAP-type C4-dicarboxylate transport system permease large subunit
MREVVVWILPLIATLFLVTYYPAVVMAVPNWLMPGK